MAMPNEPKTSLHTEGREAMSFELWEIHQISYERPIARDGKAYVYAPLWK